MRIILFILITGLLTLSTGVIYLSISNTGPPHINDPSQHPPSHTLTEFGDFACPHCANFALQILPQLEEDFITPGLLNFQYKHYPFISPGSYTAAQAAECAKDQEAFLNYHTQLYHSSASDPSTNILTPHHLTKIAASIGLDPELFQNCLNTSEHEAKVQQDKKLGKTMGVDGTPALFLNGDRINWSTYRDLHRTITEHLELHQTSGTPTINP